MDNIKNKKGLSITLVFKGQSLNYGEGIGNISELKKLTRGDGSVYTYASRQALRYDIVRLGNKLFDWNLQVVNKEKGTIQFDDKLPIQDSQEMDLFGYMKTAKKDGSNIRSAAVRLSNAISLEDYKSDMDFLNNKGLADRINEFPNLANIEQHLSYYTYTITIDLEKIGKYKVIEFKDVELDEIKNLVTGEQRKTGLPKSNVLYYELENNAWCCVRPSGTEPKIKLYMGVKADSMESAEKDLEELKDAMVRLVK